jgi:nitric oxide reductase large subunit
MANGSIWGHGAYLGPDYAAAVLDQIGVDTSAAIASGQFGKPLGAQLAKKSMAAECARWPTDPSIASESEIASRSAIIEAPMYPTMRWVRPGKQNEIV